MAIRIWIFAFYDTDEPVFSDEHYLYFTDKTKLLPPDRLGDVINQI